jgi:hypothetical protein
MKTVRMQVTPSGYVLAALPQLSWRPARRFTIPPGSREAYEAQQVTSTWVANGCGRS